MVVVVEGFISFDIHEMDFNDIKSKRYFPQNLNL